MIVVSDFQGLPISVKKYSIGMQTYSFRLDDEPVEIGKVFQNEAFSHKTSSVKQGSRKTWLKSQSRSSSIQRIYTDSTPRRLETPLKKHYITAPYGTIMRGKKLRQRHDIGNIFRENTFSGLKSSIFRNENNMRAKWK